MVKVCVINVGTPLANRCMARAYVKQNSIWPYHITGRCSNRERFGPSLNIVWSIMEDYLYYAHIKGELKIHSFVLMPNHFHLIASVYHQPLGYVMRDFLTNTSKEINIMANKINQNWGSKYFKCELTSEHYFLNAYKYVYQNPVRAKLTEKCEQWPYSTLSGLVGNTKLHIPIAKDSILFGDGFNFDQLAWLNRPISMADKTEMRLALSKREFRLPRTRQKELSKLEIDKI